MTTTKPIPKEHKWLTEQFDASELPCYAAYELATAPQAALIDFLAYKANEVAHKRGYYPSELLDKLTDVANVVLHPYGLKCNENTARDICECREGIEWEDIVNSYCKFLLPEENN